MAYVRDATYWSIIILEYHSGLGKNSSFHETGGIRISSGRMSLGGMSPGVCVKGDESGTSQGRVQGESGASPG